MSNIPIYTLPRVPGATNTTEWMTFCHSKHPFIVIAYDTIRHTSRWVGIERKRKFRVQRFGRGRFGLTASERGYFSTLEKAEAAAREIAKEEKS